MNNIKISKEIGGKELIFETGLLAKQSSGSVLVRYEDTVVLVAVNASSKPPVGLGYFPLSVEYREKSYAGGKIPGGYFKREGRPAEKEIIAARLTDRAIRPLFPKEFQCDTQVFINLLSTDQENPADILGSIGTSMALMLSDLPWSGPISTVRLGFVDGKTLLNPTYTELESSQLDLIISGDQDSIIMIEGAAKEISEENLLTAIEYGQEAIKDICNFQLEMLQSVKVDKRHIEEEKPNQELINAINEKIDGKLNALTTISDKKKRSSSGYEFVDGVVEELETEYPEQSSFIKEYIEDQMKVEVRKQILENGTRIDGRGMKDIRPISVMLDVLPRTHGSALFSRGETQTLCTVTLGSKSDEQYVDDIDGEFKKSYMLHYNFPPFSVGETKRFLGISRREVGHGNLAERALKAVMPSSEEFPYTVRVVSDILESNGSSSMASVCGGSLALMNAGVKIKSAVAGISIGLVKSGDNEVLFTDILGDEDHYGDMDFKVAGTNEGITAVQVDLKISGISQQLISKTLQLAKEARLQILEEMNQHISIPSETLSEFAPKIATLKIDTERIGDLIGPGGKNIKAIIRDFECDVNVEDDGTVTISSATSENLELARNHVEMLTVTPEVGEIYEGTVKRIQDFGAFVEILPGKDGLLHISKIEHRRIENVRDVLKLGDKVKVKILKIDDMGRIDLSRKALLDKPADSSYDKDKQDSQSK